MHGSRRPAAVRARLAWQRTGDAAHSVSVAPARRRVCAGSGCVRAAERASGYVRDVIFDPPAGARKFPCSLRFPGADPRWRVPMATQLFNTCLVQCLRQDFFRVHPAVGGSEGRPLQRRSSPCALADELVRFRGSHKVVHGARGHRCCFVNYGQPYALPLQIPRWTSTAPAAQSGVRLTVAVAALRAPTQLVSRAPLSQEAAVLEGAARCAPPTWAQLCTGACVAKIGCVGWVFERRSRFLQRVLAVISRGRPSPRGGPGRCRQAPRGSRASSILA